MNYSADIVNEAGLEVRDVFPQATDILYYFIGAEPSMNPADVRQRHRGSPVPEAQWDRIIELLLWFSFLGVVRQSNGEWDETLPVLMALSWVPAANLPQAAAPAPTPQKADQPAQPTDTIKCRLAGEQISSCLRTGEMRTSLNE